MRFVLATQAVAWIVALSWTSRVIAAYLGLPKIANLALPEFDREAEGNPQIVVVVPARNEQAHVRACVESLLAQDYANLRVIAVDDRSTDGTGAELDALAADNPERMRVMHISDLPAGWLGKSHAMHSAAQEAIVRDGAEYLLFTDADIYFRADALRRSLAYTVAVEADHMVLAPTMISRRWDEAAVLGYFQVLNLWAARAWRVANPKTRDALGIGAFNLVRASAYQKVGGFASFPLAVLEDLTLARRMKRAGFKPRVAFGIDMVKVHWAAGTAGLVGVMTKNLFAVFNYRIPLLFCGVAWMVVFCLAPFVEVWVPGFRLPGALTLAAMACGYKLLRRVSNLRARNIVFAPYAIAVFIYTLLRSMLVTLRQGGVIWRGTFYSLAELRANTDTLL
jgi:glycosyltransferase involved in cell wall biosynthesis